jgi:hypothetical protein
MRPILSLLPLLALHLTANPARALIYLPENTLESLLLRSDAVIIATVLEVNQSANTGLVQVDDTLKGTASGKLPLLDVMLRISARERKPRFAVGDRVLLLCGPATDAGRAVLHSQKLENDAEFRTMKGCITEIAPVAAILNDLANSKKPIDPDPLRKALTPLVASKNAYTQILVGRLMSTRLAARLPPDGWDDLLLPALASPRHELAAGALTWSAKYKSLSAPVRAAIEKIAARTDDKPLAAQAAALLTPR